MRYRIITRRLDSSQSTLCEHADQDEIKQCERIYSATSTLDECQ